MKMLFTMIALSLISTTNSFAKDNDPVRSPTFPERGEVENHYFSPSSIAHFNSVQVVLSDEIDGEMSFIQVKNNQGGYDLYMPQTSYEKLLQSKVEVSLSDIEVLSDDEYKMLEKNVNLKLKSFLAVHSYIGGDAGRCAAGTIGVAIGAGLAGAAVGGPAGAVAGAVGGALAGSAANCK